MCYCVNCFMILYRMFLIIYHRLNHEIETTDRHVFQLVSSVNLYRTFDYKSHYYLDNCLYINRDGATGDGARWVLALL